MKFKKTILSVVLGLGGLSFVLSGQSSDDIQVKDALISTQEQKLERKPLEQTLTKDNSSDVYKVGFESSPSPGLVRIEQNTNLDVKDLGLEKIQAKSPDLDQENTKQTQSNDKVGLVQDIKPNDCVPHPVAKSIGINHFKFPEAKASDLVVVNGYKVHKDAAPSLRQMMADAKKDGVTLTLGSAFRSVAYQQGIVNRKTKAGQSEKQIYRMSAPPGYSEHHTGMVVDFSPINSGFAKTKGYQWLLKNANKYGWYQTFTAHYSAKSGVSEESWHWKYKGSETARQMLRNDSCL